MSWIATLFAIIWLPQDAYWSSVSAQRTHMNDDVTWNDDDDRRAQFVDYHGSDVQFLQDPFTWLMPTHSDYSSMLHDEHCLDRLWRQLHWINPMWCWWLLKARNAMTLYGKSSWSSSSVVESSHWVIMNGKTNMSIYHRPARSPYILLSAIKWLRSWSRGWMY